MRVRKTKRKNNHFQDITSSHAVEVKINKSIFEFDLFWSIRDGALINIDTLINVYSQYPNTKNMKALVGIFGKKRVTSVIKSVHDEHEMAHNINMEIINDKAIKSFTAKNLAPFII